MASGGIKILFNKTMVEMKIKGASKKALEITSQQALKDCNNYCKQDRSGLINSSITASQPEKGVLRWKTPYARKQYYLKSTSHSVNDKAEWMWAHKAHSVHSKEWKEIYQKALKKFCKGGS